MMRNNTVRILEKVNAEIYARFVAIVAFWEMNAASTVVKTAYSAHAIDKVLPHQLSAVVTDCHNK